MQNALLVMLALSAASGCCLPSDSPTGEVRRIRIRNSAGGLVQVSLDGGRSFAAVGRVTTAANTRIEGFAAASYAKQGTVAAIAVHGLRIKTGQFALGTGKAQMPLIFSITPLEFTHIPKGYGGHIPRSSSVQTDIYSGHSIFRNFSPYIGSPVFIERDHDLVPLPEDYTPIGGETFVIVVARPARMPSEIEFENRAGGNVTARYADGSNEVIAEVARPVKGIGRYDGTSFTGVGAVNTNHPGVLTISTAPICPPGTHEGGDTETRGGFMIQPNNHAREQGEQSPQVMVVAPKDASKPLEGAPPIFSGCINLTRFASDAAGSYRAQVRVIDNGAWEDMPQIVGRVDNAFECITAIKLLLPEYDPKRAAEELARDRSDYAARAVKSGLTSKKGTLAFAPAKAPANGCIVTFHVDGNLVYTSSQYPYVFQWDSTKVCNGLHEIEIETTFDSARGSVTETQTMLVRN